MTRTATTGASSPSRGNGRRCKRRQYLVGLWHWSYQEAWIEARSEDDACAKAEALWQHDDSCFTVKGGGIDDITVIDEREVQS